MISIDLYHGHPDFPLRNSGPCNSFYCLGHSKNVYDDDDDDYQIDTLKCSHTRPLFTHLRLMQYFS